MHRRWIKHILLMIGSLVVGVLLAELGLRITDVCYPNFFIYEEHRGAALRPGSEGWYVKESKSYVQINSDGLRDREHSKEKPADIFRVTIFEDSYAKAAPIPADFLERKQPLEISCL